jgi:hypothetical protein
MGILRCTKERQCTSKKISGSQNGSAAKLLSYISWPATCLPKLNFMYSCKKGMILRPRYEDIKMQIKGPESIKGYVIFQT